MRFKKIKKIANSANTPRNLLLRQRWAMAFFGVSKSKKVIIQADETWLGMMDFRRMKWCAKDTTNSVPTLNIIPRISMLIAIDTLGNLYLSLTQSNSNSKIMSIFLKELVKKLDKERP